MYLSYKLKDGRHAKIFDNGTLLVAATQGQRVVYNDIVDCHITDDNGNDIGDKKIIKIKRDETGFYFTYNGQKINILDYEYLAKDEFFKRIYNKEYIPCDLLVTSLIKNFDEVAFVEQRREKNTGYPNYSSDGNCKDVVCVPIERYYKKEHMSHVIETIPIDESDRITYGYSKYYTSDFYNRVCNRNIVIIHIDDIKNYGNFKELKRIKNNF